jgi:hypothetical protein
MPRVRKTAGLHRQYRVFESLHFGALMQDRASLRKLVCMLSTCILSMVVFSTAGFCQGTLDSSRERADRYMVDFLATQERVLEDYAWFGSSETLVLKDSGEVIATESVVLRAENKKQRKSRTDIVKTQAIPANIAELRYGQQLIVGSECRESHGLLTEYRAPVDITTEGFKVARRMNEYDIYSILMLMDGDFVNNNVTSASAAMMYSNAKLHSARDTDKGLEAVWQFVHADVVGVVVLFDPKQGNMPTQIVWRSMVDPTADDPAKLLGVVHSTTLVEWTKFEGEYRPISVKLSGMNLNRTANFERAFKLKWLDEEARLKIFESRSLRDVVKVRDRYVTSPENPALRASN